MPANLQYRADRLLYPRCLHPLCKLPPMVTRLGLIGTRHVLEAVVFDRLRLLTAVMLMSTGYRRFGQQVAQAVIHLPDKFSWYARHLCPTTNCPLYSLCQILLESV